MTLELSGKRGKKQVEALVAQETASGKNVHAGKIPPMKQSKVTKKLIPAMKTKRSGRHPQEPAVSVHSHFELPNVTEEMVAEVEEQIQRLQAEAKYMRDLIAIRKKYGM